MDSACGVYRPCGLVFCHQLCNRSQRVSCFHVCYCDQSGVAYSPIYFQAALNGMSKSMSRSNIAAPGEDFNTLCCNTCTGGVMAEPVPTSILDVYKVF